MATIDFMIIIGFIVATGRYSLVYEQFYQTGYASFMVIIAIT